MNQRSHAGATGLNQRSHAGATELNSVLERMAQMESAELAVTPFDSIDSSQPVSEKIRRRRRPVIGIVPTQNVEEGRNSISERYANAVVAAGGAPLLLPITADLGVFETLFPLIDGFILSGGQDIDPSRYGNEAVSDKLSEFTPVREELEYLILSYAYEYDVPLLGVCRGMQMINVFFGGTLYQDLHDQFVGGEHSFKNVTLEHWQQSSYDLPTHEVSIQRNSKLWDILGVEKTSVNSMHHQGVKEVGPRLGVMAYGSDGLVEAVECKDRTFIMGVQWHPEFLTETNPIMIKIFEALTIQSLVADRSSKLSKLSISQKRWKDYTWPVTNFASGI